MGGFSRSYHLQTEDLNAVENALKQTLSHYGTQLVDVFGEYPGKPCPDAKLGAAMLIQPLNGWTSIVAEFRSVFFNEFLEKLTQSIDCPALVTYLDDGDYWGYMLYQNGKCLDDFNTMEPLGIDPMEPFGNLEISELLSPGINPKSFFEQLEEAANISREPVKDYNWNQHCENLLPLMKNPSEEECLKVLTDLEACAVSALEFFYQLLDISTLFIEMSYPYMAHVHPEDIEDESLIFCRHWIVR